MTELQQQDALRHLVVVRHGEARAHSGTGDEGRELTEGGRTDAQETGRWLAEQGLQPDVAIVSTAARTRQTWDALRAGGLSAQDVRVDGALYEGAVEDLLEAVSIVPAQARVVVLVAHSPAVPALAHGVEPLCAVPDGWPPATAGVIELRGEWSEALGDDARLVACRVPVRMRGLAG